MRLLETARRAKRILGKPPGYIVQRAFQEGTREADRWLAPLRERRFTGRRLLALARVSSVDQLWKNLHERPFPAWVRTIDAAEVDRIDPGESARIIEAAQHACARKVNVLGTGMVTLGTPIDWARDYRVDLGWPSGFARAIDYVNRDRSSDIKIPWEISRLQWLIPAGQAYLLTGEEPYAEAVREILLDWITANPLAYTVNWSCTMEAAIRLFTWTWLFHVFAGSEAWRCERFRIRFLTCLYLHGDFTHRHIEKADINGNHYTADLAGLVIAGYFFGDIGDAGLWRDIGWSSLQQEIGRQVFSDGVDFEASVAYHRLMVELLLWPALFRQANGDTVSVDYLQRLRAMAEFTAAYSRPDGTSPLWGDADDARALGFGGQRLGDHRYLIGMIAIACGDDELARRFGGPRSELTWVFGPKRAAAFSNSPSQPVRSAAFPEGGAYIMRHQDHHVFIDCGPIGLAGRGGHGHNDALSFEAQLYNAPLVMDRGSFVYTASFDKRNEFRSTASHNTPQVDAAEINRFDPNNLWNMQDDARAECTVWRSDAVEDVFVGRHFGYGRLGITVQRKIRLEKETGLLEIFDIVEGQGYHRVNIPFHLAPSVSVEREGNEVKLRSAGREFTITGQGDGWSIDIEASSVSPSYGIAVPSQRLVWTRVGALPATLRVVIHPAVCPNASR